jgi:hypothetical protein
MSRWGFSGTNGWKSTRAALPTLQYCNTLTMYYLNGGDAYRLKKWFPDLDYSAMYRQ